MTSPGGDNIIQGDAQVGIQAQTIHGDVHYQLAPDASAEEQFRIGVEYLDARLSTKARDLIEGAVARGYETDEVRFHRLLALLSGRTLRQLSSDDFTQLSVICSGIALPAGGDEWTAGLRTLLRLLNSLDTAETGLVATEVDRLAPRQRNKILDHLGVLLDGPMEDQLWSRSVERARAGRLANGRADRVWKFFQPAPAPPRVRPVAPVSIPAKDWLLAVASAAVFAVAIGNIGWLLLQLGRVDPVLAYLLCLAGVGVVLTRGAEWHFLQGRLNSRDAELTAPGQRPAEAPSEGFARSVDRLFDRYFARYVPSGTDRSYWLAQTAGIRSKLRDEVVETYREQRTGAERIAWLVRHLVGEVRQQWEHDTLTAYRVELRPTFRTTALYLGGLATVAVSILSVVPAALSTATFGGLVSTLAAVTCGVTGARAWFRINGEFRRVTADRVEHDQQARTRQAAYDRWRHRLADKPTDAEMATWLECDRRILVDEAMRYYQLRPNQVIAHAFIEAPASSYKRARVPGGPWRYSRYRLLLFLLTSDGVRQMDINLDLESATSTETQRLNYRFDALAAVGVEGVATQRQTFELTLVGGRPISVQVAESSTGQILPGEDPQTLSQVTLDASGIIHTLKVLEGIAAEGKEWIRHQHQRTDERLAKLAATVRAVLD